MHSPNHITSKFLALNDFHVVTLHALDHTSIRGAAKRISKDRADIKHTSVLNFICKSLGLKGGVAAYKLTHLPDIAAFRDQNGLHHHGLSPDFGDAPFNISLQDIAERCFHAGRPLPKRVFTGSGVTLEAFFHAAARLPGVTVTQGHPDADSSDIDFDTIVRMIPPAGIVISDGERSLEYGDILILSNLIGDQLVDGIQDNDSKAEGAVGEIYYPRTMSEEDVAKDRLRINGAAKLLRRIIGSLSTGWLDVLPFNDNLIFLRGPAGTYDFIVRGQKGNDFQHQIHRPFLKNADMPKSDDSYHFSRWLYFEYDGWLARDRYEAETAYYLSGGLPREHPGGDEILRRYLIHKGIYQPPVKKAPLADGFKKVFADGKWLAVSDPVTVAAFRDFMLYTNQLYACYRPKYPQQDSWSACNGENLAVDAPAAVTWYDALAYTTDVSKTRALPVRLANEEEWLGIAADLRAAISEEPDITRAACQKRFVRMQDPTPAGHKSTTLSGDPLARSKTSEGVTFVRGIDLGEWLAPKGAAINTLHLGGMNAAPAHLHDAVPDDARQAVLTEVKWENRICARLAALPPSSSGVYKHMRIGFRMVYELDL